MKKLFLLPLLALLLSCGGRPYDYINGDPKLDFKGSSRTAMVGQSYELKGMLIGRLPAPDQPVMIIIKALGVERTMGVGTLGYSRMLPGPNSAFRLRFSETDYYDALGRVQGDGLGRNRLLAPENAYYRDPVTRTTDSNIRIVVEMYLVEPHPTDPTSWVRGKLYVRGSWLIVLSCPHCVYD